LRVSKGYDTDLGTMTNNKKLTTFSPEQLKVITESAAMAEELVSNHYKMSANQWLRRRYDFRTLTDLTPEEIVAGPFAQIIRYEGKKKDQSLGSSSYDFYKICLQDHHILAALADSEDLKLFPFSLYITTHELIHIVRFSKFLCNFVASSHEKMVEEARVHEKTRIILSTVSIPDMAGVLKFYEKWHTPLDELTLS
jgi:hypothetical protein